MSGSPASDALVTIRGGDPSAAKATRAARFLPVLQHLLPRARAWRLPFAGTVRSYVAGLTGIPGDVSGEADVRYVDCFPPETDQLTEWETQFGLVAGGLDEAARRVRLDSTWKRSGGQSISYLQGVLRDSGFNVFLHEFWEPTINDATTATFANAVDPNDGRDVSVGDGSAGTPADQEATTLAWGEIIGVAGAVTFLRFPLTIPKGSRILRARLEFVANLGNGVPETINIGSMQRDASWDVSGFSNINYGSEADFPLPTAQASTAIIPGILVGDDWIASVLGDPAEFSSGSIVTFGSLSYNPTYSTDGIRNALQALIDDGIYDPASPTTDAVGFVFDAPGHGGDPNRFSVFSEDDLVETGPRLIVEWQEPAVQPLTVKNPNTYLEDGGFVDSTGCGEPLMECGEATALMGETIGARGNVLVNKVDTATTIFLGCGDVEMECDEALALCGEPLSVTFGRVEYLIPLDVDTWPYFLYIAGEVWPMSATVDLARREEFEDLLLSICPGQQWLGIMVNFS